MQDQEGAGLQAAGLAGPLAPCLLSLEVRGRWLGLAKVMAEMGGLLTSWGSPWGPLAPSSLTLSLILAIVGQLMLILTHLSPA